MSFHISKLSRYEPKKKTSPVYRAQLVYITNFPSSQLPDALCVTMKRSEHDLSRWGVCHTSLIHFNKVYFGTIISHCVSEESFIKESVDLISLFFIRDYDSSFGAEWSEHTSEERHEGIWDGNFKSELEWTDNPAWILYDIITNDRYGLGEYITNT